MVCAKYLCVCDILMSLNNYCKSRRFCGLLTAGYFRRSQSANFFFYIYILNILKIFLLFGQNCKYFKNSKKKKKKSEKKG